MLVIAVRKKSVLNSLSNFEKDLNMKFILNFLPETINQPHNAELTVRDVWPGGYPGYEYGYGKVVGKLPASQRMWARETV